MTRTSPARTVLWSPPLTGSARNRRHGAKATRHRPGSTPPPTNGAPPPSSPDPAPAALLALCTRGRAAPPLRRAGAPLQPATCGLAVAVATTPAHVQRRRIPVGHPLPARSGA
jgi:hypothetical protein